MSRFVLYFAIGFAACSAMAGVPDSRKDELRRLVVEGSSFLMNLSGEEKAFVREFLTGPETVGVVIVDKNTLLAMVDDREAIGRLALDFKVTGNPMNGMGATGQAEFIPMLMSSVSKEQAITYDAELGLPPSSYIAAATVVQLLRNSPQLSEAVHAWAYGFHDFDYTGMRTAVLAWWPANKPFFKEHDYAGVRPGTLAAVNGGTEAVNSSTPAANREGMAVVQSKGEQPHAGGEMAVSSGAWLGSAAVAGGAMLIAVGLVWVWRKRQSG